jgi:eukaryotic-like serine/threonine-protein kinase
MADGDEQTTRLPVMPATVAGRFRLAAPLPSPGGSDAFLALDLGLGREVVVRILPSGGLGAGARTAAGIDHPRVLRVIEIGESDEGSGGRPYVVLERTPGGTLATRMAEAPPPWDAGRALLVAGDIAEGLAVLHDAGLTLGSLDADRIHVTAEDRTQLEPNGLGSKPIAGGARAPELAGGAVATPASDLWALGALLHLMLTGHPYKPGGRVTAGVGIAASVAGLVTALLADAPERRPPSARAVAGRLRALSAEARTTRLTAVAGGIAAPARVGVGGLVLAFAILVAAGAGAAYAITQDDDETPATTTTTTTVGIPTAPTDAVPSDTAGVPTDTVVPTDT